MRLRIVCWTSSSVGMRRLRLRSIQQSLGACRLLNQDVQWRNIVVPLDQRRYWPKTLQCCFVQGPHFVDDSRAVIVDPQRAAIQRRSNRMSTQMDFADHTGWQCGDIGRGVPAVVLGADKDVVDVAEDAAPSALRDRGNELPLGDRRMAELQIGRGILDKDTTLQIILRL